LSDRYSLRRRLKRKSQDLWEDVTDSDSEPLNLFDLAIDCQEKFLDSGEAEHLDTTISLYQQALSPLPPHSSDRSAILTNLASALAMRFDLKGCLGDVDEAISLFREALILVPPLHSLRSTIISDFANALDARFTQMLQVRDIDEVISLYREALELRVVAHPNRFITLTHLSYTLDKRFNHTDDVGDINEAKFCCSEKHSSYYLQTILIDLERSTTLRQLLMLDSVGQVSLGM